MWLPLTLMLVGVENKHRWQGCLMARHICKVLSPTNTQELNTARTAANRCSKLDEKGPLLVAILLRPRYGRASTRYLDTAHLTAIDEPSACC